MTKDLILSNLHITLAIIQLLFAGITFISNPKAKENRAISALLTVIGIVGISIGALFNAISYQEASIWMFLIAAITYVIGPATLFVSLIILQPKVANNQIVSILMWTIFLGFPILAFLDFVGLTSTILGFPLIYEPLPAESYFGGYPGNITGSGNLRPIATSILIGSSILELFFPALYTFFRERRRDPLKSRFGLLLSLAFLVAFAASTTIRFSFPDLQSVPELLSNLAYAIAFTYLALQRPDSYLSGSSLANIANNFPVRRKLLVLLTVIVLPSIAIISTTSLNFLQNNIIALTGENQNLLASLQADFLREDIEDHISLLDSEIAHSIILVDTLNVRESRYAEMTGSEINQEIRISAQQWAADMLPQSEMERTLEEKLNSFIETNHQYTTLAVIDSAGAIISAVGNPSMYIYNDEIWFRTTRRTNQPNIDISTDREVFIAVPVQFTTSAFGGFSQGYIYAEIEAAEFYTHISTAIPRTSGGFEIFAPEDNWIPIFNSEGDDRPILRTDIFSIEDNLWRVLSFGNNAAIISWDPVQNEESNFTTQWMVVSYIETREALQAVILGRIGTIALIFIVVGGAFLLATIMSRIIIERLQKLTSAAEQISSGERDIQTHITGEDEIGTLAKAFDQVTKELNDLVIGLEDTINERTEALEKRASQLETSALVAREAASIRDTKELMNNAVELIPERFGFYHTGIFLVDDRDEYAVLQAANSPGGKRMLARGHKLQIGKVGVVGYAAGMGQARIAQDVGADVVYYDNPDMPDTQSELALPLKVRDQIIGVLDVQSTQKNAFQREDLEVLQVLADQIALAIESARLLQSSQEALNELEYLYGQQVSQAWQKQLAAKDLAFRYTPIGTEKESPDSIPPVPAPKNAKLLTKDIVFRGESIGKIELMREDTSMDWTSDEIELVNDILEQTALALESARLVDQIRMRSGQIQLLQEITALAATTLEEQRLLKTTAEKMQRGMDLLHCGIAIFDEEMIEGVLVADATRGRTGESPFLGDIIQLEGNELTLEVISSKQTLVVYDVENNPRTARIKYDLKERGTYTLVIVPLVARGQVFGTIGLDIDDPEMVLDEEDLNLLNQISAQISTALDQIRLFQAEQQGRRAASALLEITQIASSSLDLNQTLREVSQRSAAAAQAYRCTIALYDQNTNMVTPVMSQFAEPGKLDRAMWEAFKSIPSENADHIPIFQQLFNERQPIILDDPNTTNFLPESWTKPFEQTKLMVIPMVSADNIIGFMAFDHIDPERSFNQSQVEIAQTIAGQVATTVANATLFDQTVRRAERERMVAEITSKVRASNDPQIILQTAVHELRHALKAKQAKVLLDNDTNTDEIDGKENGK